MGDPMPLASHAVAAPADAAVSPTVWLLPGITVPAAKKKVLLPTEGEAHGRPGRLAGV